MERLNLSHQVQMSTQMTNDGLFNVDAADWAGVCLFSNKRGV